MRFLLVLCAVLIVNTVHAQRTDNLDVFEMLLKAKYEYVAEGVGEEGFKELDSVYVRDMPFPNVGWWERKNGRSYMYLHPYALRDKIALEYTLLHELGHMHGLLEHDDDPESMMYKYHEPPENEEEWIAMKKKYYDRLRLMKSARLVSVE